MFWWCTLLISKLNTFLGLVKLCFYKVIYGERLVIKSFLKTKFSFNSIIKISNQGKVIFDGNITIRDFVVINVTKNGVLYLSNGVFLNNSCRLNCHNNISIGSNTLLGEFVCVYDHDHLIQPNNRKNSFKTSPISIGSDVWIGSQCVLTRGIKVGNGSVIGAQNCIRVSVAPNMLYKNINEVEKII